jgi:tyrosine-protein kinase Etk/Wzc
MTSLDDQPAHSGSTGTDPPATESKPVGAIEQDDGGFLALAATVADNLRLLVLAPFAVGLVVWLVAFMGGPVYTASTSFLPPQQQQSIASAMLQQLGALGSLAGATAGLKNPIDQYIAFLKTRAVEDALVSRFNLQSRYETKTLVDTRKLLEDFTRVTSGRDGLITLEFTDRDPKFAAEVANGYVEELTRLLRNLALTEAEQRRAFFETQLVLAKNKLTAAEQALTAGEVDVATIKGRPEVAVAAVAGLQARIAALEVKLDAMRGYLSDKTPEIRRIQAELATMRAQLTNPPESSGGSAKGVDYIARYRDFKYYETLYEILAKQYEAARMDESRDGATVQVIDRAVAPELRSGPKRALRAVVAMLVVELLLLLWLFTRQAIRDARRNPDVAERLDRLRTSIRRAAGRA